MIRSVLLAVLLMVVTSTNTDDSFPQITENPVLKAVEIYRNTVMICRATGNPKPQITWLKDRIPVNMTDPRLTLLNSGSLQIKRIEESDDGEYQCIAENSVGTATSYPANLYVRVRKIPPSFKIEPESIEVLAGESVNLTCVAIGSPMPFVKWRKGSEELTNEDEIPVGRNVLTLTNVQKSANYTCVASSTLGEIESVAEIRVKVSITLAPRDQKVKDGDFAMFVCKAAGDPKPTIHWSKHVHIHHRSSPFSVIDIPGGSILRIDPVNVGDDNMTITCEASNGIGAAVERSASLSVFPKNSPLPSGSPRITEHPTLKAVEKAHNTVMICEATGNPKPQIIWLRDMVPLDTTDPRLTLLDSGILQIERSQESDEGRYECMAENSVGTANSYAANLYVRAFPQITENPVLKAVEIYRNTVMICRATGNPKPQITWLKDRIPVNMTDPRLTLLNSGSLQIKRIEESDDGEYQCIAENSVGTATSYPANLYVRVRKIPPSFKIEPESIEVLAGESVNLTCVAIGSPMPFVKWRKGSEELTNEDEIPVGRNVLTLTNVQKSANYTCVASSTLGEIESVAEIRVKVSITLAPRDQKVKDGDFAMFVCKAAGDPKPTIHWSKHVHIHHRSSPFSVIDIPGGSILRIDPVNVGDDNMTITCEASNGIGAAVERSASLSVFPKNSPLPSGFPRITEHPTLKAVEKAHNTVMICEATGNPKPQIIWLRDMVPLDTTDPRLTLLDSGILQIERSQESDEGRYECMAENSVGTANSYAANLYVRVRYTPPSFSVEPKSADVLAGGSIDLTCVAVGRPMPFVKWRKGSEELTNEDEIPVGRNVLTLTNLQKSANYTCVASSTLGEIESVAEIRVKGISTNPQDQKVQDGDVATFFCKTPRNPEPKIRWYKNRLRVPQRSRYVIIDIPGGPVLRIDPVKARFDNGATITCEIRSDIDPTVERSASLSVFAKNSPLPNGFPRITKNPSLKAVEKAHDTVMICEATGNPKPRIIWLRDMVPLDTTDPRLTLLDSGILQIERSRESDEGRYECIAENSVGTATSYPANLYVRVRRIPPRFIIEPESADAFAGESVNLTCVATGSPMPYVKWRKGSEDLTNEDEIPSGRNVLMLTNVQKSANYTCVAASTLGEIESVAEIRVKGISTNPQDQKVQDGEVATFFCKTPRNPEPKIRWYKNRLRVPQRSRYVIIDIPGGSVLRIDPVKARFDNGATITCEIRSDIDPTVERSASLSVFAKNSPLPNGFPRITKNPSLKAVEKAHDTVMICEATGNPKPQIIWLRDMVPLDTTDPRLTLLDSGILQIERSQESDEGRYECMAVNSVGTANSYPANLYVRGLAKSNP
ncbi:hemicentin-1-like [Tubulanus polymorphus]|uniref:hemicentin-1-like n=1 Tax=Tubulanus polymorphus TaxID=672921 RepID=UPI003DA4E867